MEDDEGDAGNNCATLTKRRRKGQLKKQAPRKPKRAPKNSRNDGGEFFDLDAGLDDACEEEDEEDEEPEVNDHQLGFYKGEIKKLVSRAIVFMRMFLLNMDAYPEKEELIKWAEKAFNAACQMAYGVNYKGMQ